MRSLPSGSLAGVKASNLHPEGGFLRFGESRGDLAPRTEAESNIAVRTIESRASTVGETRVRQLFPLAIVCSAGIKKQVSLHRTSPENKNATHKKRVV